MKVIHPEVRYLAILHYEEHKNTILTCTTFHICRSSLWRYRQLYKLNKSLLSKVKTQPSKFTNEHHTFVLKLVSTKTKYYTVRQIQSKFQKKYNTTISERTIRRILRRERFVYKKLTMRIRSKKHKTSFLQNIKDIPLGRLLAVDEMGFGHGFIHPKKSWCRQSQKNEKHRYRSRFEAQSKTVICVTSTREIINYQWGFKPLNTTSFVDFLRVSLLGYSGYYLILDNVSFHKSKRVHAVLSELGVNPVFIDPYTPEQNPIEEVFSSIKYRIRAQCPCKVLSFKKALRKAVCHQSRRQLEKYFNRSTMRCV